jgi:hypothetical protein
LEKLNSPDTGENDEIAQIEVGLQINDNVVCEYDRIPRESSRLNSLRILCEAEAICQ